MKKFAIIGSNGMLGSDLVRFLRSFYQVTEITKENYSSSFSHKFDVIINANGNSKRFWANEHPVDDFIASTLSVYKSIFDFNYSLYIYLSSSDIYEDHSNTKTTKEEQHINPQNLSPYGLHKYFSEILVRKHVDNYIILRSSMILGKNLKKGPFYDILHKQPLFIAQDSRLQLITTKEIANIIHLLLNNNISNEVFNIGGVSSFSFKDIQKYTDIQVSFSKNSEKQEYEMNIAKLQNLYPIKTSNEYVQQFFMAIK